MKGNMPEQTNLPTNGNLKSYGTCELGMIFINFIR